MQNWAEEKKKCEIEYASSLIPTILESGISKWNLTISLREISQDQSSINSSSKGNSTV